VTESFKQKWVYSCDTLGRTLGEYGELITVELKVFVIDEFQSDLRRQQSEAMAIGQNDVIVQGRLVE
jgi:hypothetical protein